MVNILNVDIVNINAYIKFGENSVHLFSRY